MLVAGLWSKPAPCEDIPPQLAQQLIEQTKSQLSLTLGRLSPTSNENLRHSLEDRIEYLSGLETNWNRTLRKAPHDMHNASVAQIQEIFQFYFSGRTNFEEPTVQTLLRPRVPFAIDKITNASASEKAALLVGELRLRVEWFQLLSQLHPAAVMANDGDSLVSVNLAAQYLWAFAKNKDLLSMLESSDFDTIASSVNEELSKADDSFLKELAGNHQKRFGAQMFSSESDRYARYIIYRQNLDESFRSFYANIWQANPAVLETRMFALALWMHCELKSVSNILSAAKTHPTGNKQMVVQIITDINTRLLPGFENTNETLPTVDRLFRIGAAG